MMDNNVTNLETKQNIVEKFYIFMSQERFLKGASLARIGLGLIILYNYIIVYFQRNVLYGPNGILGDNSINYSLYNLFPSQWYFELLYHAGMFFAFLFIVGYKGRIVSIINYILTLSFIRQGFLMTDGGDNLMYLLLFYLLFADTTAYYSWDAAKKKQKNRSSFSYQLRNIFHNFAIVACIIQVCILYFISGLYQVKGDMWSNGTALYYIMQTDIFANPYLTSIALSNDTIMVLVTYASILIKLAFPFLIINKRTKYFAVISIVFFHLGIGIFMGLVTFSLTMIIAELLLFTDEEYEKFSKLTKDMKNKIFSKQIKLQFTNNKEKEDMLVKSKKVIVLYDGWCPLCIKSVNNLKRFDLFNSIEFLSFRDSKILKKYNTDIQTLEKRMHSFNSKGKANQGIDAFIQIIQRMPLLWILLPFLYIAKILGFGQHLYDYIASKRKIIPVGQCNDKECNINYFTHKD